MSPQVTALKWRPQVFADMVGQEHITRSLQNAMKANRVAHAYIFAGPRGVGKTTTAPYLRQSAQLPKPQRRRTLQHLRYVRGSQSGLGHGRH